MSAEKKKELQVAALENGTAIDHIPPSQLFKVAKLLGLENMDNTITIGNNFHSNKMGCKGGRTGRARKMQQSEMYYQ